MADIEKMKAELERLQEKEAVLKARRERQMARINTEKRKQRNKRLIEKGAVLEDIQAQAKGLRKVPKVARVAKSDDPQGYAKYQAYREYTQKKEEVSASISPEDSMKWLYEVLAFNQWASNIQFSLKDGSKESALERFKRRTSK